MYSAEAVKGKGFIGFILLVLIGIWVLFGVLFFNIWPTILGYSLDQKLGRNRKLGPWHAYSAEPYLNRTVFKCWEEN